MLAKTVKFIDFDGKDAEETHYFNFTKPEILEFEFSFGAEGGLEPYFEKIVEAGDNKALFALFRSLVLDAYGVRSEDGKRFIKSPELRAEFAQTAAYPEVFMSLATDEQAAVEFFVGILPRDLNIDAEAALAKMSEPGGILDRATQPTETSE